MEYILICKCDRCKKAIVIEGNSDDGTCNDSLDKIATRNGFVVDFNTSSTLCLKCDEDLKIFRSDQKTSLEDFLKGK